MNEKSNILFYIFLSFLLLILCYCGNGSPEKSEIPKPRAIIRVAVKEGGPKFYHNSWFGYWYSSYTILVSEHNGVGGRVTIATTEVLEGNQLCTKITESGGTFPPNGTCEISCYLEVDDKYKFDKLKITVEGRDNNGYSFKKSISYTYSWENNILKIAHEMN